MVNKRKLYSIEIGRCGKYKYKKTSGYEGGVVIFIKKRLFGFLWWVFVKDVNGCPIIYNHFNLAQAFMEDKIGYYDQVSQFHYLENGNVIKDIRPRTDEVACHEIIERIKDKTGEVIEQACAQKAWEFDGRQFIHVAVDYAMLWHQIFKANGKKLWLS